MGKSRSHIANLMRLLQLDDELKRLLSIGELSVGHAKVLLGVEDADKRLALGQKAVLEGWTVRQIEEAIASGSSIFTINNIQNFIFFFNIRRSCSIHSLGHWKKS